VAATQAVVEASLIVVPQPYARSVAWLYLGALFVIWASAVTLLIGQLRGWSYSFLVLLAWAPAALAVSLCAQTTVERDPNPTVGIQRWLSPYGILGPDYGPQWFRWTIGIELPRAWRIARGNNTLDHDASTDLGHPKRRRSV
jgi:hypothetical protein